jgi:hypothetical protein
MINFTEDQMALHQIEVRRRALPTAWQNFVSRLRVAEAAPMAVSPYAANPIGIDVSHYQPKVDWAALAAFLQFGIAKGCEVLEEVDAGLWYDPTFAGHIDGMAKAKIPALAYIFANGGAWALRADYTQQGFKDLPRTQNLEYMKLREVLQFKQIYGLVIDVERYWRYYNQYLEYLAGNRKADAIEVLSSTWIFFSLKKLVEDVWAGMKAKEIPMVPIFIYTAPWFVDTYMNSQGVNLFRQWAPSLQGADIRIYLAAYTAPTEVTSWEDVRNHLPTTKPTQVQRLGMTVDPFFQQFSGGSMKLPNGQYGTNGFDVNVALVSTAEFRSWLNLDTVTPPPPPTPLPGDLDSVKLAVTDLIARMNAIDAKLAKIKADL